MNVNRKEFLAVAATGAVGLALAAPEAEAGGVATLGGANYKAAVGQTFHFVAASGRATDLVLRNYVAKPNPKTMQFTLLFDSPSGQRLEDGTYTVTARGIGTVPMFILSAGMSNGRPAYRADFNVLPTTSAIGK